MTSVTKGIEIKNKGMLLFGIILLLIGLVASLYPQIKYEQHAQYNPNTQNWEWITVEVERTYPYQTLGMVLVLAGIVFIALGFFYSPRKTEPIKPST